MCRKEKKCVYIYIYMVCGALGFEDLWFRGLGF